MTLSERPRRRFRSGLVVGKLAPLHRGHQHLIERARGECERVLVMLWSNPDFESMPSALRAGWVRALHPDVEVLAFEPEDAPPNDAPDEAHHAFVRARLPHRVDAVFSGEGYGPAFARALAAEHVAVERVGGHCGTAVRSDPHAHRASLDPRVYAHFVEKVVFLGAESSGKSTLARALARRLDTEYVEEVGRTLWVAANGQLPLDQYERICREHVALEDAAILRARRFVFVDTNAITTQQYAFFFFGTCPDEVRAYADRCKARYAHTFLCAADIPFEQDGTRVHPQVRRYMDGAIRNDLAIRGIPYHVVGGPLEARIEGVLRVLGVAAPPHPG